MPGTLSFVLQHSRPPRYDSPSVAPSSSCSSFNPPHPARVCMKSACATFLSVSVPHGSPLHSEVVLSSSWVASLSTLQTPLIRDSCKRHLRRNVPAIQGCSSSVAMMGSGGSIVSSSMSRALPLFVSWGGLSRKHGSNVTFLHRNRQRVSDVRVSSLEDSQREVLQQVEGQPQRVDIEKMQPLRCGDEREGDGVEIGTDEREGGSTHDQGKLINDKVWEMSTARDIVEDGDTSGEKLEENDMSGAIQGTVVATLLLLVGVAAIGATGFFYKEQVNDILTQFSNFIEGYGPAGYGLFVLGYTALEVLALPAIPLTMSAGLLFGTFYGTILVSISGTLAATVAFLIARYLARDQVLKLAQGDKKFLAIDKAIGEDGFRIVTLLRLSPLLPFALGNYLYGLTSVRLLPYVLGSWLGMLPGTWAYVSAGAFGRAFIAQESESAFSGGPEQLWMVGLGVVATIVATSYVTRIAKDAIKELE